MAERKKNVKGRESEGRGEKSGGSFYSLCISRGPTGLLPTYPLTCIHLFCPYSLLLKDFFKLNWILFMRQGFCLHDYLWTMSMRCLGRPEQGVGSGGTEVTDSVSFRVQGTEQVNCKSSRCVTSSLLPPSSNSQACRAVPSLLGRAQILPSGSGYPPFSIWLPSKAQPEKATSSKQPSRLSGVNRQVFLWVPTHPEPSRTVFFASQGALAFSWAGQIAPAGSVTPD